MRKQDAYTLRKRWMRRLTFGLLALVGGTFIATVAFPSMTGFGSSDAPIMVVPQGASQESAARKSEYARIREEEARIARAEPEREVTLDEVKQPSGRIRKTLISWVPRLFTLEGVLSYSECDYLRGVASKKIAGRLFAEEAQLIDHATLPKGDDPIVKQLVQRVSTITMLPVDHFDAVVVWRFNPGAVYDLHSDLLPGFTPQQAGRPEQTATEKGELAKDKGGQRIARVFVNLKPDATGSMRMTFPFAETLNAGDNVGVPGDSSCYGNIVLHSGKSESVLLHTIGTDGKEETPEGHYKVCKAESEMWVAVVTGRAYSLEN